MHVNCARVSLKQLARKDVVTKKKQDDCVSVWTGLRGGVRCVEPETVHVEELCTPLYSLYINYIQTLTGRAPT